MKILKVEAVYPMALETFDDVIESLPRFIDDVYDSRLISVRLKGAHFTDRPVAA